MNLCDHDYDDDEDARRYILSPRGVIACSDRTCGAEDCPTCHPECFDSQGRYVGDDDDNAAGQTPAAHKETL